MTVRTCSTRSAAPFAAPSVSCVSRPARCAVVAMAKPGLHPEWHDDAPVLCNGVEVMRIGGTKDQYKVDIYSGNHPFYQGNKNFVKVDNGQLVKFKKRFAELDLKAVDLAGPPGMVKMEKVVKPGKGKGGKK